MYACEAGHVEVAEYLLNNGATVNYVGRQLTFKVRYGAGNIQIESGSLPHTTAINSDC